MNENNNGGQGDVDLSKLTEDQIKEIDAAEDFILGFKDEDYNDPDKVEELKQAQEKAKTTIHQKRHFREKATKLEGVLGENNIDPTTGKPKVAVKKDGDGKPVAAAEAPKGVDPVQVLSFRQDNPTYSKEVVAEISRIAGAFGVSMEEAAVSPTGKAVITTMTNTQSNADAGIEPTRKAGAGLEKKDWSNASPAEMDLQRRRIMGEQV